MTDLARTRRLKRLQSLEARRRRLAEQAFARSVRDAAEAAAGVARIEGLLLVTAPAPGRIGGPALIAAAQLRGRLEAAARQAREQLHRAQGDRGAAEAVLGKAIVRARRLEDLVCDARLRAHRQRESRGQ